jgi:hypothetical protein
MSKKEHHLYAKDSNSLQIPFAEYKGLIDSVEEGRRLNQIKTTVLGNLKNVFSMEGHREQSADPIQAEIRNTPETPLEGPETVSVEFSAQDEMEPVEIKEEVAQDSSVPKMSRSPSSAVDVPPIKKDIAEHFNKLDSSGRLFNVFKQYYTCMNKACGGTVRVTIKDGFCSLWNYDEWDEFSFIDLFDNHLRIAVNSRYTEELKSLNLCEVPKLLASRGDLICVQVDDLNNTVLSVLSKAFNEVGKVSG